MNTENLEKINNLLDFAYLEICEIEQTNKTKFAKAAIELAVEKIQEIKKEKHNEKETIHQLLRNLMTAKSPDLKIILAEKIEKIIGGGNEYSAVKAKIDCLIGMYNK